MQQTTSLPEIRISFSLLLYEYASRNLDLYFNKGDSKLLGANEYKKKAQSYRQAWTKYERVIVQGMIDVLGVAFYQPVIDVSLAPYFSSQSAPLIINFRRTPDEFVDTLTHELLHVLQTDNNRHQTNGLTPKLDLEHEWRRLFGKHEHLALVHIPLHAIHKQIYLDVLNAPERMEREIESVREFRQYRAAWEYVNRHDYREIVSRLRRMYERA